LIGEILIAAFNEDRHRDLATHMDVRANDLFAFGVMMAKRRKSTFSPTASAVSWRSWALAALAASRSFGSFS
jgi:hypothetical protein